jgi:hypothetical protein
MILLALFILSPYLLAGAALLFARYGSLAALLSLVLPLLTRFL